MTNVGNDRLPVLFRETNRLGPPAFNATPVYPFTGQITNSATIYDPNITVPYSQSWTFGIQREIGKDMAFEVRYIGTRNLRGWGTFNLNDNEDNILENGLFNEFKLAQKNLQAFITANPLCGTTGQPACSYAYKGLPGQSPLPITLAYFSGIPASQAGDLTKYTSSNFTSSTFTTSLALFRPTPLTYADNLSSDAGRRALAITAGLPSNFILTNPDLRGGANFITNTGYTRYDALQLEFRRRMSKGLLVQTNYTFANSFVSSRLSFRVPRFNILNTAGGGIKHNFKVNWIYELPFGKGKMLFGGPVV